MAQAAAAAQAQQPAQGQAAPVVAQQPLYAAWRKTITDYTRNLMACDGSNKPEIRALLDSFEALRQWTTIPEPVCITALGYLTKDMLRDSLLTFLQNNAQVGWNQVRTHIENTFLENNEPDYQRRELEKIQQGTYEDAREYSQHYKKALARAYTPVQLQDPVHLGRVVRCYIRGLYNGDIREKVYDSTPATLEEAMQNAHTYAHSRTMRAERNGPKLDNHPHSQEGNRRKEEPMDVGYLTQAVRTVEIDQKNPEPIQKVVNHRDDRVEGVEKKLRGMQKQITSLTKGQVAIK